MHTALLLLFLSAAAPLASAQDAKAPDSARFRTNREGRDLALTDEQPSFSFAVFGDRTGGPPEGVKVLAEAVDEVNLFGPDLVMTVGDLIQGYCEEGPWLTQMEEYRGIMERLDCPWYPVAGNHDVYWRGPEGARPEEEHERRYERHFGPLWYAFRHKGAWFVVLYSDEGNPETTERNFSKPECQRMSPEQFEWLRETLEVAKSDDHVFLFLHHPRWIGGNYGDDWERVHELLARAGNVRAVFAGHIHHMRYDGPRDGIEYFTLATVGGGQSGLAPSAGFLHQYELVTVREGRLSVTSYPVGSATDPRTITGQVSEDMYTVVPSLQPVFARTAALRANNSVDGEFVWTYTNPSRASVELQFTPRSDDPRWSFMPAHQHQVVGPGESSTHRVRVLRRKGELDESFRMPEIEVAADYLTEAARFALPVKRAVLPVDAGELLFDVQPEDRALVLDGRTGLAIPSANLNAPGTELTVEFRLNARAFASRQGLVAKTENSEWGFFANDGALEFLVHLGGEYVRAKAAQVLEPNRWYDIAGVYDGAELRLYVDGELSASAPGGGDRARNRLPLVIGGDVDGSGRAVSLLNGALDELRISTAARYRGASYVPATRHPSDEHTALLLHFDSHTGVWTEDASSAAHHPVLPSGARLERVD